MGTNKNINGAILLEYFSGKLLDEQRANVEAWFAESDENEKLARDIYYIYYSTETLQIIREAKTVEALRSVRRKIIWQRLKTLGQWTQRAAAILFIPLLCVLIYLYHLPEKTVEYIELRTNSGMIASATLPDGSKIWLNSGSCVTYPTSFNGNKREIKLEGEAYFSIRKNENKPFVVHTHSKAKVEVLGTEFNLEAYRDDKIVKTTLVSGSVLFTYPSYDNQEMSVTLKPNETIQYDLTTKKTTLDTVNIRTNTAWKEGLIILRNTPFRDALKILEKRFNAQFNVKNEKLYEYSYTGQFDTQQLALILEHFRVSSGIQYRFIEPAQRNTTVQKKTIVEIY